MTLSQLRARLLALFRQPSSIGGFGALFGTLTALASGQLRPAQAIPLAAGALVSILLPDNTAAKRETEATLADLIALSEALGLGGAGKGASNASDPDAPPTASGAPASPATPSATPAAPTASGAPTTPTASGASGATGASGASSNTSNETESK